ncbi:Beta-galactosidase C-terminal domain [Ornithinimicrobium cerasi]|uniref:Beta-galactosidase C-terminal domain n=1 Tax=Ornithinimicrobium cerasi TaxID=2248773 RepID=UPI000EFEEB2E|nr:Beta-galactosidase C-terminal domain [Ornithinimicrobium cerasi]
MAAFSPWAAQEVLDVDPRVFAVRRTGEGGSSVVSLTNLTGDPVSLPWAGRARDLLDGTTLDGRVELDGYAVRWLVDVTG